MPKRKKRPGASSRESTIVWDPYPKASTIARMHLLSSAAEGVISRALTRSDPDIMRDDQESIARIEQAQTPDELLDLTLAIVRTAEQIWQRRVQAFGPEILPLISARLKVARDLEDKEAQTWIEERLISVLYRFGDAGASALIHCFDDLNDYAKSLASVVLGLLGAHASADRLWVFYERAWRRTGEHYFIGPLWGLVDLGDPRASDAVADLLWAKRYFFELFPMAYKVGDARAVCPLLYAFLKGSDELRENAVWALAGVAHRIGRDALLQELRPVGSASSLTEDRRLGLADAIATLPIGGANSYFAPYFQGLGAEAFGERDIQRLMRITGLPRGADGRKR